MVSRSASVNMRDDKVVIGVSLAVGIIAATIVRQIGLTSVIPLMIGFASAGVFRERAREIGKRVDRLPLERRSNRRIAVIALVSAGLVLAVATPLTAYGYGILHFNAWVAAPLGVCIAFVITRFLESRAAFTA